MLTMLISAKFTFLVIKCMGGTWELGPPVAFVTNEPISLETKLKTPDSSPPEELDSAIQQEQGERF